MIWIFVQAIKEYGDIDVYTANFRPLKATLSGLPDRVFMKLIVCAKSSKVLGLHMCGEDAPEIVQVGVSVWFFGAYFRLIIKYACNVFITMKLPGICGCSQSRVNQGGLWFHCGYSPYSSRGVCHNANPYKEGSKQSIWGLSYTCDCHAFLLVILLS